MEKADVLQHISERTGGDIYLGVVGPVRTGKSTFIKRFMELLVLPNIEELHEQEIARDELPQSGAGKTVTVSYTHLDVYKRQSLCLSTTLSSASTPLDVPTVALSKV